MLIRSQHSKSFLFTLFSVLVVVSNILSGRVIETPFTLFNSKVVLPGSAFVYLLTFIVSGLVNELYGQAEAKICVKFGLINQILALLLFFTTGLLPANDPKFQKAYQTVLGTNFVFVFADIVSGFTAQFMNVVLFPLIKKNRIKNKGIANCISILISQLFDTIVFLTVSFGIGLGYLFTLQGRESLCTMIVGQYVIKIVVCALSIPFFNKITKRKEIQNEKAEFNL